MKRYSLFVILVGALVSGCSIFPQTAEEYRQAMTKMPIGTSVETFEVERPYSKVAATWKAKAKECLDTKFERRLCAHGGGCVYQDIVYTPTIVSGPDKTEVHVQWESIPASGVYVGGKPPPNGKYITVADAIPAGKNKTKVTIYSALTAYRNTPRAIKHWANGTNLGCPNLADEN